jgi:hypothetical protein
MYAAALKRISPDVGDIAPSGAPDPLNASVPLPHHHVLFPYGFPVQIKTNELGIIRAAEQSWAAFPQRFRETPLQVRLLVSGPSTTRRPPFPVLRAQANLLTIVADSHNFACCDLASGFGFASLTKAVLLNRDYLRHHFLERMVYSLLDTQHLVKVPAACVAKNGHGVLFVGGSGAGKSSLAYACARRGWTYISDDGASLVRRRPGRQVLGNPQNFRFHPAATELFPELRGRLKLRDGKLTVEVRTEVLTHLRTATECTVDYIVFLERHAQAGEPAWMAPLSEEECLRGLFHSPWPPELPIHHERLAAVERLLKAHLYRMTYCELDPAIDLLEQMIDSNVRQTDPI